jgi:hypothetical protein
MRKRDAIIKLEDELRELKTRFEKMRDGVLIQEFITYAKGKQFSYEKRAHRDVTYMIIEYDGLSIWVDEADYLIRTSVGTYRLTVEKRENTSDWSTMCYVESITKE